MRGGQDQGGSGLVARVGGSRGFGKTGEGGRSMQAGWWDQEDCWVHGRVGGSMEGVVHPGVGGGRSDG